MVVSSQFLTTRSNHNESSIFGRAIFFLILGLAFYALDRYAFIMADDYHYAYKLQTEIPINSLIDILESEILHYQIWNGRFLVHCIVQLFAGIWGFELFIIFNSLFFVAFCALTTRFIFQTWRVPIAIYALTSLLFWIMMPSVGITFLSNIACAVNYPWVAVVNIAFLILMFDYMRMEKKDYSTFAIVCIFLFGLIAGSLQESFSIPIAGAMFIYCCVNIKKVINVNSPLFWLLAGYFLGTAILVLAPANFVRLQRGAEDGGDLFAGSGLIMGLLQRSLAILCVKGLLMGFIILHSILFFIKRSRNFILEFISENKYLYAMLIIGSLFIVVIAYAGSHQLFFNSCIILILLLKLLNRLVPNINIFQCRILLLTCLLAISPIFVQTLSAREEIYQAHKQYVKGIQSANSGVVVAKDWIRVCAQPQDWISRNYTRTALNYRKNYHSLYWTGQRDRLQSIVPCLAEEIDNLIATGNNVAENIFYIPDIYCYVFVTSPSPQDISVEIDYPALGFGTIKRKIMNLPMYVTRSISLDDLNVLFDKKHRYYFYYDSSEILDIRLITN